MAKAVVTGGQTTGEGIVESLSNELGYHVKFIEPVAFNVAHWLSHIVWSGPALSEGVGNNERLMLSDAVQPFPSMTLRLYNPEAIAEMVDVEAPVFQT